MIFASALPRSLGGWVLLLPVVFACGKGSPPAASPGGTAPAVATSAALAKAPPATAASAPAAASVATSVDTGPDRTHEEVRAVLQRNRDKFRACYDAARKQTPALQGSFVLDFILKPSGAIQEASYNKVTSEIKDDVMGTCALAVLRTLSFAPSKKGMETKVSYPFGFKSGAGSL